VVFWLGQPVGDDVEHGGVDADADVARVHLDVFMVVVGHI
jgi:hypothetical protein